MQNRSTRKGYLFVFIAGMFWGTTGLFIELLFKAGAGGSLISALRVGTALLIMIPAVGCKLGLSAFRISKRTLALSAGMGFFGHTVFNLCYTAAVDSIGVATSAVLLYSSLFFVCVLSRVLFGEPITTYKILGIIVNIAGCVLTVTGGQFDSLSFAWYGTLMGLGAAAGGGSIVIFGKILADDLHPYVITFYNLLFGMLFLSPFLLREVLNEGIGWSGYIAVLGVLAGIASAWIPELMFMVGLAEPVEASRVNVFASSEVIVAALIGIFAFQEFINAWKLVGMWLVLCSILLINLSPDSASDVNISEV